MLRKNEGSNEGTTCVLHCGGEEMSTNEFGFCRVT
jgi:hypothetical protein